jgi:hypothetical protein
MRVLCFTFWRLMSFRYCGADRRFVLIDPFSFERRIEGKASRLREEIPGGRNKFVVWITGSYRGKSSRRMDSF